MERGQGSSGEAGVDLESSASAPSNSFLADKAPGKLLHVLSLSFPAVRKEHHPPSPAFLGSSVRLTAWQETALSLGS